MLYRAIHFQHHQSGKTTELRDELAPQLRPVSGQVLSLVERGGVLDGGIGSGGRSTGRATGPGRSQTTATSAQGKIVTFTLISRQICNNVLRLTV